MQYPNPIIFLLAFLCSYSVLNGQTENAIVPDRPGLGESAYVIPQGIFQIESGINLEWDAADGTNRKSFTYNSTTLRYGISDYFEVRAAIAVQQELLSRPNFVQNAEIGLSPWSIGFKAHVTENTGLTPRVAFLGNLAIPFGSSPSYRISYFAPSFLIPLEWDITQKLLLTINTGTFWNGENAIPEYFGSAGLDYVLLPGLGIFIESYLSVVHEGDALPGFDAGFVWRLTPDLQLDLSAGLGLNSTIADGFVNGGISYRITPPQKK